MMGLLVFKEKLKQLYGKYNRYMIPAVKFLLGASHGAISCRGRFPS